MLKKISASKETTSINIKPLSNSLPNREKEKNTDETVTAIITALNIYPSTAKGRTMKIFKVNVNGKKFKVTIEEIEEINETTAINKEIISRETETDSNNSYSWDESWVADNSIIVRAPMAGIINEVAVKANTEIKKGDLIAILEAMKMENELRAHRNGIVKEVLISPGQLINQGDIIMIFT